MNDDLDEIERWVRSEFVAAHQDGVVDVAEVAAHPSREVVACTVSTRASAHEEPVRQVAIVDLDSKLCELLGVDAASSTSPIWSPDGACLALLASPADGAPTVWVVAAGQAAGASARVLHRMPPVGGAVEQVVWSPGGDRLCMVVAQFGAEVSDVYGSGTVPGPAGDDSWRPSVSPAPEIGRRVVYVWDLRSGTFDCVRPELNVWEASWNGSDRLVALASESAGEGAWYAASLFAIGLDGSATRLHRSDVQLAQPRASASGEQWSVIAARASDRGLLAGTLVVGTGSESRSFDTANVDVTAQRWLDEHRIAFAGLRGLTTVFGVLDVDKASVTELFCTGGSSGLHQPEVGAFTAGGSLVTVLERHDQPPTLTAIVNGATREVLSTAGPGMSHLIASCGSTKPCAWRSTDGVEIEGLLTVPPGTGPHPLVVNVHGGPVAAWRDGWIGKDPYAAVLVSRGFAVLRPNPRGSAGRGAAFVEAVVRDMGGRDVDDIVTGVAAMVDRGVTEPGRVGITGNSYGGYMAAWIPCWSDAFAAAVSRSPVTDWQSQHLTGNLAEFDEIFVGGDPFDAESQYATRSPLTHHRRIKIPILFTAGAHDLATPASQAQQLHRALLEAGVTTQLAVYPEEGHGVRAPDALADQLARMIFWFETHL